MLAAQLRGTAWAGTDQRFDHSMTRRCRESLPLLTFIPDTASNPESLVASYSSTWSSGCAKAPLAIDGNHHANRY